EQIPRVAGAEGAHDEVMALRRVLDGNQVIPDRWSARERAHTAGGIIEERALEGRVGPGPRDNAGADMRADLRFIGLDDAVKGCGIDIALLRQYRFQSAHAELRLRQLRAMVMALIVMVC